jgi:hypothetical protein
VHLLSLKFGVVKPYKSKSGKESGVIAYKTGTDFIVIQFRNKDVFTYTYKTAGEKTIEKMKALAANQMGLATFISQNEPAFEK